MAFTLAVHPTKVLLVDWCAFRLNTYLTSIASAVRLAKGMTTRDQRDRFRIVHRHAGKGFANITR